VAGLTLQAQLDYFAGELDFEFGEGGLGNKNALLHPHLDGVGRPPEDGLLLTEGVTGFVVLHEFSATRGSHHIGAALILEFLGRVDLDAAVHLFD